MPPDPPRMSCYVAELPLATMIYSSQFILVATLTLGPLHFWIASYGPDYQHHQSLILSLVIIEGVIPVYHLIFT